MEINETHCTVDIHGGTLQFLFNKMFSKVKVMSTRKLVVVAFD